MTKENDLVVDPFIGVGTTAVASLLHNRKSAGADIEKKYLDMAKERIELLSNGELKTRPMNQPIYKPKEDCQDDIVMKFNNNVCLGFKQLNISI